MFVLLHKIRRAVHPERAVVKQLRVDHGDVQVLVAQQLLTVEYLFQLPRMNKPSRTSPRRQHRRDRHPVSTSPDG